MFGSTLGAGTTNLFGGSTSQPSSTYTFGSTLPSNQIQQQKPTFGSALSQPFGGGSFFGSNTTNFGNTGMNLLSNQAKQPTFNNLTSFGSGLCKSLAFLKIFLVVYQKSYRSDFFQQISEVQFRLIFRLKTSQLERKLKHFML